MNKDQFTISYKNVTLTVHRFSIGKNTAYRITFSSSRQPLVITRGTDAGKQKFWTSVPQGRQKEAEGIGIIIEEYLTNNP